MTELEQFLKSNEFLKLGQAINRGNWKIAALTVRRMESRAKELGLTAMERPLLGVRQAVNHKNSAEAKQALANIVAKRVQMLNQLQQRL